MKLNLKSGLQFTFSFKSRPSLVPRTWLDVTSQGVNSEKVRSIRSASTDDSPRWPSAAFRFFLQLTLKPILSRFDNRTSSVNRGKWKCVAREPRDMLRFLALRMHTDARTRCVDVEWFGVNEERAMEIAMEIAIVTSESHCCVGAKLAGFRPL